MMTCIGKIVAKGRESRARCEEIPTKQWVKRDRYEIKRMVGKKRRSSCVTKLQQERPKRNSVRSGMRRDVSINDETVEHDRVA